MAALKTMPITKLQALRVDGQQDVGVRGGRWHPSIAIPRTRLRHGRVAASNQDGWSPRSRAARNRRISLSAEPQSVHHRKRVVSAKLEIGSYGKIPRYGKLGRNNAISASLTHFPAKLSAHTAVRTRYCKVSSANTLICSRHHRYIPHRIGTAFAERVSDHR
jgi:hypothetical protein